MAEAVTVTVRYGTETVVVAVVITELLPVAKIS